MNASYFLLVDSGISQAGNSPTLPARLESWNFQRFQHDMNAALALEGFHVQVQHDSCMDIHQLSPYGLSSPPTLQKHAQYNTYPQHLPLAQVAC